jgi:diacylglycerol kinase
MVYLKTGLFVRIFLIMFSVSLDLRYTIEVYVLCISNSIVHIVELINCEWK